MVDPKSYCLTALVLSLRKEFKHSFQSLFLIAIKLGLHSIVPFTVAYPDMSVSAGCEAEKVAERRFIETENICLWVRLREASVPLSTLSKTFNSKIQLRQPYAEPPKVAPLASCQDHNKLIEKRRKSGRAL